MKIFVLGDVVGNVGCEAVRRLLPAYRRANSIDLVIANSENAADGNGLLPASAEHLFASGVDLLTGGNHTFRRREIYPILEESISILRPANLPAGTPGTGFGVVDLGFTRVCVINLLGTVYLESLDSPFAVADQLIRQATDLGIKNILVDFHAEATSEKRALGYYLDGRVTALWGTHTHVPTADVQILPAGTAYITDVGMCGPVQSVLGVEPALIIEKFTTKLPVRFKNAAGPCSLNGFEVEIDHKTGKALSARQVTLS